MVSKVIGKNAFSLINLETLHELGITSEGRAKVEAFITAIQLADILKVQEITLSTNIETDLPDTLYTVTAGKTFYLCGFCVCTETGAPVHMRLKVDGTLKFKAVVNGAGNPSWIITPVQPLAIASGGQVIKITAQPTQAAKATIFGAYWGFEK